MSSAAPCSLGTDVLPSPWLMWKPEGEQCHMPSGDSGEQGSRQEQPSAPFSVPSSHSFSVHQGLEQSLNKEKAR